MDAIADALTIIRNGYLAGKREVAISYSKFKEKLAGAISEGGYANGFKIIGTKPQKRQILIQLRYNNKTPSLKMIKIVSRQGRRIYVSGGKIPYSAGGSGVFIISTSKGLLTDKMARKENLGGEIICEVF